MPLKLVSPYMSRERILAYGTEGTGKTEVLISCLRHTNGRGFILENDNAWERVLDYLEPEVRDRITHRHVPQNDWEAHIEVLEEFAGMVTRDDWLGIDMITALWKAVQRAFAMKAYGKDIDDLFVQIREQAVRARQTEGKEGEKDSSYGGFSGKEWNTINTMFTEQLLTPLVNWPCHVVSMAEAGKLQTAASGQPDREDKAIKTTYGKQGMKPEGQKRVGHIHQSVFYMSKISAGDYYMTPIKDRMREKLWVEKGGMNRMEVGEFAKTYLFGIAGWKWKKVE